MWTLINTIGLSRQETYRDGLPLPGSTWQPWDKYYQDRHFLASKKISDKIKLDWAIQVRTVLREISFLFPCRGPDAHPIPPLISSTSIRFMISYPYLQQDTVEGIHD